MDGFSQFSHFLRQNYTLLVIDYYIAVFNKSNLQCLFKKQVRCYYEVPAKTLAKTYDKVDFPKPPWILENMSVVEVVNGLKFSATE